MAFDMNPMDDIPREPIDDGGPAFPQHGWTSDPDVLRRMEKQGGMTLLDWFAGQALAGMLAYPGDEHSGSWHTNASPETRAIGAYDTAAAMLAEKRRREGGAA